MAYILGNPVYRQSVAEDVEDRNRRMASSQSVFTCGGSCPTVWRNVTSEWVEFNAPPDATLVISETEEGLTMLLTRAEDAEAAVMKLRCSTSTSSDLRRWWLACRRVSGFDGTWHVSSGTKPSSIQRHQKVIFSLDKSGEDKNCQKAL